MAGALKGPVCEKIIDSNYLIYAGNKNHRLSVYNPNEVTFLYYAFLKAQSYMENPLDLLARADPMAAILLQCPFQCSVLKNKKTLKIIGT